MEPLTQFRLHVSGQGQDVVLLPNQTSFLVCSLIAGTSYTFSIAAGNVAGLGPAGSISQIAIGSAHPAAVRRCLAWSMPTDADGLADVR